MNAGPSKGEQKAIRAQQTSGARRHHCPVSCLGHQLTRTGFCGLADIWSRLRVFVLTPPQLFSPGSFINFDVENEWMKMKMNEWKCPWMTEDHPRPLVGDGTHQEAEESTNWGNVELIAGRCMANGSLVWWRRELHLFSETNLEEMNSSCSWSGCSVCLQARHHPGWTPWLAEELKEAADCQTKRQTPPLTLVLSFHEV